jgi:hypothetical protein
MSIWFAITTMPTMDISYMAELAAEQRLNLEPSATSNRSGGYWQAGESALIEVIMRRYNQRLYRVVQAILRGDSQAAYVQAYEHLDHLARRTPFGAWLPVLPSMKPSPVCVPTSNTKSQNGKETEWIDVPRRNLTRNKPPLTSRCGGLWKR